jgi:hypothetical protein
MNISSRFYLLGLVLLSLAFSASCGQSRSALKKADYCPTKYKAIALSSKNFKETKVIKKGEEPALAPGKYEYVSSEFYYFDKARDIRIHFTHSRSSAGQESKDVKCIGGKGIKTGMQPLEFQLPFISSIISKTNGKGMISEGLATLSIKPNSNLPWLSYEVKDKSDEKKEGSMKDRYPEYESEQIFAALKKNNLYEYRAQLKDSSDNKSDLSLSEVDVRVLVTYKLVAE